MALSAKSAYLSLLALAVVLEVIADILLKKWSINARWIFLVLGLAIYFIGTISWAYSLRFEYLSKSIVLFTLANLIAITLISSWYFHEQISLMNKMGIFIGIVSIILIES